ncbi:MAG: metallophosphoesterase [Hydrogenophilales bacterium]|nr:metallophosphoesterase [Hydrogenophilales bacterium]
MRIFSFIALFFLTGPAQSKQADPVVLIAGDVAQCDSPGAHYTAQLIKALPYPVLAAGDLAYRDGTPEEFANCYAPTWGAFKDRTYPAPGNHDYRTPGAAGYFGYFGVRAGDPAKGYYSFNFGQWHIVSLNSNRELEPGSKQLAWLAADLRQHAQRCVLAFWHHPRFSSGPHGNDGRTQTLWEMLYRHGVSVLVTAHDHDYERFPPMNAAGERDERRGIRSFIAGTGGAKLYELKQRHPLSQVWQGESWGVLKFTLRPRGYDWEFLPVAGGRFQDAGSAQCMKRHKP